MSKVYREHDPVIIWIREKMHSKSFVEKVDATKVDTIVEITTGICGQEGCNFTCRTPCEAIKFLILLYLYPDTGHTTRKAVFDQYIALYG